MPCLSRFSPKHGQCLREAKNLWGWEFSHRSYKPLSFPFVLEIHLWKLRLSFTRGWNISHSFSYWEIDSFQTKGIQNIWLMQLFHHISNRICQHKLQQSSVKVKIRNKTGESLYAIWNVTISIYTWSDLLSSTFLSSHKVSIPLVSMAVTAGEREKNNAIFQSKLSSI